MGTFISAGDHLCYTSDDRDVGLKSKVTKKGHLNSEKCKIRINYLILVFNNFLQCFMSDTDIHNFGI